MIQKYHSTSTSVQSILDTKYCYWYGTNTDISQEDTNKFVILRKKVTLSLNIVVVINLHVNIWSLVPQLWIPGLISIVSWTIVEWTFVEESKVPWTDVSWTFIAKTVAA